MEHYSFQGPYAYRWLNDVPVERIHLRNGERCEIRIGVRRPVPPPAAEACSPVDGATQATGLRALMAAWN